MTTAASAAGGSLGGSEIQEDASVIHFVTPGQCSVVLNYEYYLTFCPQTPNCIYSVANVVSNTGTISDFCQQFLYIGELRFAA